MATAPALSDVQPLGFFTRTLADADAGVAAAIDADALVDVIGNRREHTAWERRICHPEAVHVPPHLGLTA